MTWQLRHGHVLDALREMSDQSVHCVVTSPPYWGLRSFGTAPQIWGSGWVGELGSEPTIQLYIEHLVDVFAEVKRVLRNEGTLWLNIGSTYSGSGKGPTGWNGIGDQEKRQGFSSAAAGGDSSLSRGPQQSEHHNPLMAAFYSVLAHYGSISTPKRLLAIPELVQIALELDGWIVRSDIAWAKLTPMPESVRDRPTSAWEHIFLLSKSPRYFYDAEAVRQSNTKGMVERFKHPKTRAVTKKQLQRVASVDRANPWALNADSESGANLRNFWLLGPERFPGAHFATFPTEIPRRAILAGTSAYGCCASCGAPWQRVIERTRVGSYHAHQHDGVQYGLLQDGHGPTSTYTSAVTTGWEPTCKCECTEVRPCIVLDPFAGSGTSLFVAEELGRDSIGIELSIPYMELAKKRLRGARSPLPDFVV